jgi:hypothetical protein
MGQAIRRNGYSPYLIDAIGARNGYALHSRNGVELDM